METLLPVFSALINDEFTHGKQRFTIGFSGNINVSITPIEEPPSAAPLVFWHRLHGTAPTYAPEVIAVAKHMIPIFNVSNPLDAQHPYQKAAALAFQAANGDCLIAMSYDFWPLETPAASLFDIAEWTRFMSGRLPALPNVIHMLDAEPYTSAELVAQVSTPGTAEQVALARAFVAAQEKFDYVFPDRRLTPEGSIYNILPDLGVRKMNELTYNPNADISGFDTTDVFGLRVTTDGRGISRTPEDAKAAYPGRDRMYFTGEADEAGDLEIVNRL